METSELISAFETIKNLNSILEDDYVDTPVFILGTDGKYSWIEFNEEILWDDTDEVESLDKHLRKEAQAIINNLKSIRIWS